MINKSTENNRVKAIERLYRLNENKLFLLSQQNFEKSYNKEKMFL